jgi:PH (Pleckstrin Homology) domain-containing protein
LAQSFKVAPYGAVAWVWTVSFIAAVLFFGGRALLDVAGGRQPQLFDVGAAAVLLVLLVYGWLRSVRGYSIEGDRLVIHRAGPGKVNIAIPDIEAAEADSDLGSFINPSFLSTGGLFGWAGKVKVRKPMDVNSLDAIAYGTTPAKAVLLALKNGRLIVVTPNDPNALETALQVAGVSRPAEAGRKSKQSRTAKSGSGKRR